MPVQYQPYRSMYVSQRSPEISQMLRQRYIQNFAMQNELQKQLNSIQAAPFEGDRQAKNQLDNMVNSSIQQFAERKDYENMTAPIMSLVSQYESQVAPIQKNRELYDTYKATLDKQYENKDIDYEDYQGALAISSINYNGLTRNEDGSYGNYFSGTSAVINPDIPKRIKEALDGIAYDEFGANSRVLGQGENGELTVETEFGIQTVSPEKVNSVLDAVFMDQGVQAYLQRKGQIRSLGMDPVSAMESIQALYPGEELNISPEKALEAMPSLIAGQMESQYRQSAISKYSFNRQETSEKFYWDKWWLEQQKNDGAVSPNSPGVGVPGLITTQTDGRTVSEITTQNETYISRLQELSDNENLQRILGTEFITFDDLFTLTPEEVVSITGNKDTGVLFSRVRQSAVEARNAIAINERLLETARQETGFVPENITNKLMSNERVAATVESWSNQFGVDTNSTAMMLADFSQVQNDSPSPFSGMTYEDKLRVFAAKFEEGSKSRQLADYLVDTQLKARRGLEGPNTPITPRPAESSEVRSFRRTMSSSFNLIAEDLEKVNGFIEQATTRNLSIPEYTNAPGLSDKVANKVEGALKDASASAFNYINPNTGKAGSLQEIIAEYAELGEVSENFDVASAVIDGGVKYSPFTFSTTGGTISFAIKDKDGNSTRVHTSMANVDIPALDSYLNSAPYQLSRAISLQYGAGYDTSVIRVQRPDGEIVHIVVKMNTPEGDVYTVTDQNGNPLTSKGDLKESLSSGYLSKLFDDGARILPL